jgi:biopolymer transport protein ExbD
MAKFIRKGKGGTPGINTASLPDIVFMILMFFMVSTSMRQTDKVVQVTVPEATEIAKLERKDLSSYIYIGTPMKQYQEEWGTDSRIQLNDTFKDINYIRDFVAAERDNLSESDRNLMSVSLKIDQETRMGIVSDVKQELRRCSALKIMYAARPQAKRY